MSIEIIKTIGAYKQMWLLKITKLANFEQICEMWNVHKYSPRSELLLYISIVLDLNFPNVQ